MNAGIFVRQRRQELGLSQADLALRLQHRGVSFSRKAISEWERGLRHPRLDEGALAALADALKWDIERLKSAIGTEGI